MENNSHKLLFSEIKEKLKDQLEAVNSLDNKAGIALGFIGALLVGLINSTWFISLEYYYMIVILALLILTILSLLKAYFVRTYRKDPEPTTLIEGYQNKKEEETLQQLIRNFESCFNKNKEPLEDKKKYLNWGFSLLAVTVFSLCLVIFLSTQVTKNNHYNKSLMNEMGVSKYDRYR